MSSQAHAGQLYWNPTTDILQFNIKCFILCNGHAEAWHAIKKFSFLPLASESEMHTQHTAKGKQGRAQVPRSKSKCTGAPRSRSKCTGAPRSRSKCTGVLWSRNGQELRSRSAQVCHSQGVSAHVCQGQGISAQVCWGHVPAFWEVDITEMKALDLANVLTFMVFKNNRRTDII